MKPSWQSIELSPAETTAYHDLLGVLSKCLSVDLADEIAATEILGSQVYSFDFKRKLVHNLPMLESIRTWGFENFDDRNLFDLIGRLLENTGDSFTLRDIDFLVANPNFLIDTVTNSAGPFHYLFTLLGGTLTYQAKIRDHLVGRLIEKDLMNLEIAEFVLGFNEIIKNRYEGQGVTLTFTNVSPILEWAREKYDMSDVPDSWVSKLIMGES